MDTRNFTFRCPSDLAARMDAYAESRYWSRAQVMREAMTEFLKRRQPEVKQNE